MPGIPVFKKGIPIFRISKGNENWLEKSGVKLLRSTEERKRLLVQVSGRFENLRVQKVGIPL